MEQDYEDSGKEMMNSANPEKKKKKETAENRCKRFSDEQVKLLESVFSHVTKLEPKKKVQLAKDIGLHPRQVSIWFQNKRARWRSKQMELEYRVLKDEFDALNQQFESLKKENESLLEQIQTLRSLFENSQGGYGDSEIMRNKISEAKENIEDENNWGLCSDEDDDESGVEKYLRKNHKNQEILQFLSMQSSEHGSSSLASPDKNWCDLLVPVPVPVPSGGFLDDESCSPSSWWN